jgi:hypothetical protein
MHFTSTKQQNDYDSNWQLHFASTKQLNDCNSNLQLDFMSSQQQQNNNRQTATGKQKNWQTATGNYCISCLAILFLVHENDTKFGTLRQLLRP